MLQKACRVELLSMVLMGCRAGKNDYRVCMMAKTALDNKLSNHKDVLGD